MTNKFLNIMILLLSMVFSTLLFAQKPVVISIEQAISMGIKNNPALKIADTKSKLAQNQLDQIKDRQLPNAKANASFAHYDLITPFALEPPGDPHPLLTIGSGTFDAYMAGASVSEDLFKGFYYKNTSLSSKYLLDASRLDAEKDKDEIAYNVIAAYLNIYKILKSQALVEENIHLMEEKEKEAGDFLQQGLVTGNEVLKIQLQQSNLQLSKIEIEDSRTSAMYSFKLMIGSPDSVNLMIDTTQSFKLLFENTFNQCLDAALQNRVELKSNASRIKAADYNLQSLKSAYYPTLGVSAGYNYINPSNDFIPGQNLYLDAWNIGLNLSYNISALYTGKHRLDEVQINIEQLSAQNEQQTDMIKSDVFQNHHAYQVALQKIEVTQKAIAQATENFRIEESKYKNSMALVSDLIEANSMLLQAQINNVNAKTDAELAYYKLLKSTGSLTK